VGIANICEDIAVQQGEIKKAPFAFAIIGNPEDEGVMPTPSQRNDSDFEVIDKFHQLFPDSGSRFSQQALQGFL
jgi:hypothetical protein